MPKRIRRTNTCDDCKHIDWIEHSDDTVINHGYCSAPVSASHKDTVNIYAISFESPYKRAECKLWEYTNPR
mgnify:CR=1 FL=1